MITVLVLDGHGNVVKEDLPKIEIKQIPAKAREPLDICHKELSNNGPRMATYCPSFLNGEKSVATNDKEWGRNNFPI
ncbi:hypothetical protein [Desulfobacter latus]|uniref:Uncharacterized protein n=1 Tax=Desulfobacter latus TaxID=2292 RepID=A0A850T3D7_9BACT|nr:hypothetical protein [Desulfobacter latus]NWH06263.1 hypothetical protein [Desulfobacter latus]